MATKSYHRDLYAILPADGQGGSNRWVKIGVSFLNQDGSENIVLDALPISRQLQLRSPKPKKESDEPS